MMICNNERILRSVCLTRNWPRNS